MLPIDPIGLGAGAGLDRVSAVQRVMEAMRQPMAGTADALSQSTQLQQLTQPGVQHVQATAHVFQQVADHSVLRQRQAALAPGRDAAAEPGAPAPWPTAQQPRAEAPALALNPGHWMAGLQARAWPQPGRDHEADQGDGERDGQGERRNPGPQGDDAPLAFDDALARAMPEAWLGELPLLSYGQVCRAIRAQGQAPVLERLAQGRCVLAVLRHDEAQLVALLCPSLGVGVTGPQGEAKLFRARVVGAALPGLWRVRQQATGLEWGLQSDAGAPPLWLSDQAPADAPGLHVAHGQRMRLDVARQWVMWVVNLKGDANQWAR